MNRLALILCGAALFACFGQACSSSDATGDDDDDDSTSSGGINRDASTTRPGSSSGSTTSSSGGSSSSSSGSGTSSSSSGGSDAGNRCDIAAARTEARYTECGVDFAILDAGAPPECTDARATDDERVAQCVQDASCGALRGDDDAGDDAAAYYACISGDN